MAFGIALAKDYLLLLMFPNNLTTHIFCMSYGDQNQLKGLSHEMDLAFDDNVWLVLGLNRGRGHFFLIF